MRTVSSPSCEIESRGDGRRWRGHLLLQHARADCPADALHLLGEAKQVQGVVGQLRLGDEGADAMFDDDVAAAGEIGQRLPGGHAADTGALGQLAFGGKLGPGASAPARIRSRMAAASW